jgi:uncharacterized membrane protein YdcZ (DUF606 family)
MTLNRAQPTIDRELGDRSDERFYDRMQTKLNLFILKTNIPAPLAQAYSYWLGTCILTIDFLVTFLECEYQVNYPPWLDIAGGTICGVPYRS